MVSGSRTPSPMPWLMMSTLHGDGVRHHLEAQLVRFVDQRAQRGLVHRGHVGIDAVAPAVGEDLEQVRLVRGEALHGVARLARRQRELRVEVAAAALHAVAERRGEARRHQHARRIQPRGEQAPHGLELLGVRAQIDDRGDAVGEVELQDLGPVEVARAARRQQVRVQIEQPGEQRAAFGVDHGNAGGHGGVFARRGDAAVVDEHGHAARRRAAAVDDLRAGDRQPLRRQRSRQQQQCEEQPACHPSILRGFRSGG